MNKVIRLLELPKVKPEHLRPPHRGLHYFSDLTKALESRINELLTAHNTATQGVGPAITSAPTISVSNAIHPVSGTATVTTITASPGFSGPIYLLAKGAFSLGTGGNIAVAKGPFSAGEHVALVYNDLEGMWYPRS